MASDTETRPWPAASMSMGVWPPDDTEESVVGTNLHQMTITNLRWGINEIARLHTAPGVAVPWQALSQTIVMGFARADGSRYKTLPDVFVYSRPIDQNRPSLTVELDGPPILIIEALSESTYDVDLGLKDGKAYSYAHAGVREYLTLDPTHAYVPEGGRAWRLEQGVYQPWEPDADGRWRSAQIDVAIGLEGAMATVYTRAGGRQPREGEVGAELARREDERRAEGLVEGQRQALRVLVRARFGVLPQALEQRIAAADAAVLDTLIERAATAASLDAL
jgi:hypothetical protein